MVSTAYLLGARLSKGRLWRTSRQVRSLCSGKALNGTPPPLCGKQVAQFSLQKEGWRKEGHPTAKIKMPGNADYSCGEPMRKWE